MPDSSSDLCFMPVAEAARLIAARRLSPVELTEALLQRINALDPQLNAFITVTSALARAQAHDAEAQIASGRHRGPLHGIPYALKDIYATEGIQTSAGSRICLDNVPTRDAATVRRLHDAGAVLLGKLQTHEFALGGPSFDLPWPPSRNPWHLEHFTGGSSSGSAAALAGGLVPASLGSDTGGSIRGPASLCGLAGLMPTTGLVSRTGVIPNSFTLDHCGPMARTVEDCAILLQAMAGFDPLDAGSIPSDVPDYRATLDDGVRGLRIGVLRHYWEEDAPAHPDLARAMEDAIRVFRERGASVEDCRAWPLRGVLDTKLVIAGSELFSIHHDDLRSRPGDFGRDFLGRVLPSCLYHASDYLHASREQRRIVAAMQPLHERYDVLITAGASPAPRLDEHRIANFFEKPQVFTPANVTGVPALVLPVGFSDGLPMGMQILGRPFDEATVLRVGHAYQQATDWHLRHPRLVPGTPQPVLAPRYSEPAATSLDAATLDFVLESARRAGLALDDRQTAILLETAPSVLAVAGRLRRMRSRSEQPSLVFRFPGH
ncbi:MAG: amidase [bacterium]|jgi:aspartyl-tRNA(Asn)/glutamyl-tRNA(Gln) amidotransferase subunit A|nr:amidase [Betaproteobacteria bacterium]